METNKKLEKLSVFLNAPCMPQTICAQIWDLEKTNKKFYQSKKLLGN